MNFFGHATVASWGGGAPARALGAMLPDFENMCRGRVVEVGDDDLAAGIDLHHATDAAFHELPAFVALCGEVTRHLQQRGLARGPAVAGAHVGIELFLDGWLLDDGDAAALYTRAIRAGRADAAGAAIRWSDERAEARWWWLQARLEQDHLPRAYRDPDAVADRLVAILAHRPLLSPGRAGAELLRRELPAVQARVRERARAIMAALRERLSPAAEPASVTSPRE